jgi:ABC-2 type transport system ATP-binding protein
MGRRDVLRIMERLREHATIFYSTHILDDVQRVSDNVAILNHGELVAQAPIEELLIGSGGTVYSITFKRGYDEAQNIISEQDWVSGITVVHGDIRTTLQVAVVDKNAAEDNLLNLAICDGNAIVTEFRRRQYELEEIFVELVEGSNNGR